MKKILQLCVLLMFVCMGRLAAQNNYSDGIFVLNEDWFGHNNSTLNFLNTQTGEFEYQIIQTNVENNNQSLGCTAQFGAIYGDNIYIISKQDQDSGEGTYIGSRVVVADARTMVIKKSIPVIFDIDGKSAADGRGFVGVDETKGYVGTSNGIFVLDLNTLEITKRIVDTENPLITGDENNADGNGPLYNNQIGMMLRTSDYVFAIYQDKGVLVVDPVKDEVVKVIPGCFSTMTQSKDGNVWVGINSNSGYQKYPYGMMGEQWKGNQILKIDPVTLDTSVKDITGGFSIGQTWYAWTAGSLCSSAQNNVLYFTYNPNVWDWFTTSKLIMYDIDKDVFSEIHDSSKSKRYFYGCGVRINPADDQLYASMYKSNTSRDYFFYKMSNRGEIQTTYTPVKRYWFPALFIFPDNYAPVVSEFEPVMIAVNGSASIDLGAMATDADNLDVAIVKRVISVGNNDLVSASIRNNTLTVSALDGQTGTTNVEVRFNSNGKIVDKTLSVTVGSVVDNVVDNKQCSVRVYGSNGLIHVKGVEQAANVKVYNIAGQLVASKVFESDGTISSLRPGQVYIVWVGANKFKIIL
jgi:hypothetical protein